MIDVEGNFQVILSISDIFTNGFLFLFLQVNKDTIDTDERKWTNQIENQRDFYEKQISELREQLQTAIKEKNEIEANQLKFQSMSSEYEERQDPRTFLGLLLL